MTIDAQENFDKTKQVWRSYARMSGLGILAAILAVVAALCVNVFFPFTSVQIKLCEYFGYVCWSSTLGMLGWEIQTWGGDSPPEKLNKRIAQIMSLLGIFAFILARELTPLIL